MSEFADTILEAMDVGLHVYRLDDPADDHSFRITQVNAAAARLLAPAGNDLVDRRLADAFPHVLAMGFLRRYAAVVRTGAPWKTEHVVVHEDHSLTAHAITAFSLPDRHVGVLFEDVTARAIAQRELRRSEEIERAILRALPDHLYRVAADGTVRDLRTGSAPLALAEVLARHATRPLPPGGVEVVELAEGGRDWEIRIVEGPDEDRLAIARDVSERKRAERSKDDFIGVVGHELRTPLTSIHGALALLEAGVLGEAPAPMVELISVARSNTDRLVRLINDLLDLDRMEGGEASLELVPLPADELIDVAIDAIRPTVLLAGIRIRRESTEPLTVLGDRERLLQMFTNLLSNAVRYSSAKASVTVSVRRAGAGRVRFAITNADPGHRGSGLGYALCKAILEQHNGTIVPDDANSGTFTFEVREAKPAVGADELLRDLRTAYRASLPAQVERLVGLLRSNADAARDLCHRLHGTAGTYGVPAVSDAAERAERRLREGPLDDESFGRLATELRSAVSQP